MRTPDQAITRMNEGRMADVALSYCRQFVDEAISEIHGSLENDYRSGKTDAVTLSSKIAAVTALKDLIVSMEAKIKLGHRAQRERDESASESGNPS